MTLIPLTESDEDETDPEPIEFEPVVTSRELAKILGCTRETINKHASAGKIPIFTTGPRGQRLYSLAEVRNALAARQAERDSRRGGASR